MASEIRVDKINSLSGVGTVTLSPTGVDISGITTVQTLKVGTGVTASEDGDIFFTGVCTATTFTGSGANLTNLPAANLSGTLPAISAANLTNVPAANVTGTLPAISGANLTSLTAANLSGALPAISAASCTSIPAANIVGLATAGFNRSGGFPAGVTMADSWRITANFSGTSTITSNWEQADTSPWEGYMDAQLTESSGIFTFPSTGWYFVIWSHYFNKNSKSHYNEMYIQLSNDSGGSYTNMAHSQGELTGNSDNDTFYNCCIQSMVLDITNISTQRMRWRVVSENNVTTEGSSAAKRTGFDIFKLGDT